MITLNYILILSLSRQGATPLQNFKYIEIVVLQNAHCHRRTKKKVLSQLSVFVRKISNFFLFFFLLFVCLFVLFVRFVVNILRYRITLLRQKIDYMCFQCLSLITQVFPNTFLPLYDYLFLLVCFVACVIVCVCMYVFFLFAWVRMRLLFRVLVFYALNRFIYFCLLLSCPIQ